MNNEKVYQMSFAKVYSLLVSKAVKKGRNKNEVDTIVKWLTGYQQEDIEKFENSSLTYADFFENVFLTELESHHFPLSSPYQLLSLQSLQCPSTDILFYLIVNITHTHSTHRNI